MNTNHRPETEFTVDCEARDLAIERAHRDVVEAAKHLHVASVHAASMGDAEYAVYLAGLVEMLNNSVRWDLARHIDYVTAWRQASQR